MLSLEMSVIDRKAGEGGAMLTGLFEIQEKVNLATDKHRAQQARYGSENRTFENA